MESNDKKCRRMESNRESARRSRQRKQQHLDDLIRQVGLLQTENQHCQTKIAQLSSEFSSVDAQNKVLRADKERLVRRLESLESIIEMFDNPTVEKGGHANGEEGPYNSNLTMKPWQLPCPSSLPLIASRGYNSYA